MTTIDELEQEAQQRARTQQISNNGTNPQNGTGKAKEIPKPTHDELRDRWLTQNQHIAYGLRSWRKFDNGMWGVISDSIVKNELLDVIETAKAEGIRPTATLFKSVFELTRIRASKPDDVWQSNSDYLVCNNGTLHIPTRTLLDHDPELYAISGVSYDYDPSAKCDAWQAFLFDLATKTDSTVVDFLQQFAGYAITTDTQFEIAVWLYGPPGSGKSTFLTGLETALGDRSGLLGLANIMRSQFALSNIPGKTLAIATEQPGDYLASTDVLNAIISGEKITVEKKFLDPVEILPRCKLAWAMNELPRVSDPDSGLFRRVKVVDFPVIPEAERDPNLKEQIKTEGAGILNWALDGLDKLKAAGRFYIPQLVTDATKEFKENNDIPAQFIDQCCTVENDQAGEPLRIKSSQLYNNYKDWCFDTGHRPQSSTSIAKDWKRLGFSKHRLTDGVYWVGIGLNMQSM